MIAALSTLIVGTPINPQSVTAYDKFSTTGTTCQDVIDAASQLGCLSSHNGGVVHGKSKTLVTKFASYIDDWLDATESDEMSAPFYQSRCDLPVVVEVTLVFKPQEFLAAKATGFLMDSAAVDDWIYGYIPGEYGLISTFFGTVSSFTKDGTAYDPTDPMSVPREGYVNVIFDTSDAAAAWLEWVTANKLMIATKYKGVNVKSFIDVTSPKTRLVVTGMCAARANELIVSNEYTHWDFSSLTKWSLAIPLRKVNTPLIDMSLAENYAQFTPFDHWEDTTSSMLSPPTEFSTFADTCNTQAEATHMQCRLMNAKTSLASHYVTDYGTGPLFSSQKLSCQLPVAISVQVPLNATAAFKLMQQPDASEKEMLIEAGCGFIYSSVPARHGLISSMIGGSSTFNDAGTSIYRTPGTVPRDIRLTMSFTDSTAAYVWLKWFATYEHNYGQNNGGVRYDFAYLFDSNSRVLVFGMCADQIQQLKEELGSNANFLDFTYASFASTVRPTRPYMLRPDGWK